jgi:8-oxo-dGTP pyrophosphatase MutT (NUDIX family)
MQVYAALYRTIGVAPHFLVVKKREFNNWWKLKGDGGGGGPPHLVNQAGQWAFPGGKAESGNWTGDAKREFTEETGMPFPNNTPKQIYKKGHKYTLYVFEVTDDIATLANAVKAGVQANAANAWAPSNTAVEDWELGDAVLVPLSDLHLYLGAQQPVSLAAQAVIANLPTNNYSQSIDWYGEMAAGLKTHFAGGAVVVNL